MKTFTSLLTSIIVAFLFLGMLPGAYAQTGINYQAVARDGSGNIMKNKTISVRFTINDASSNQVYQGVHNGVTTSDYGVFALVVGSQNPSNFNSVNWSSGDHELVVDIDPNNGSNWTTMGTKALQGVPYSYHADMGLGDLNNVKTGNISNDQLIKWDGSNWVPTSSIWSTSGSDAFYDAGNVAIGKKSPKAPLDIAGGNFNINSGEGDLRIGGPIHRLKVAIATGGAGAGISSINSFGRKPQVRIGGAGNSVLRVDSQAVSIGASVLPPNPIPEELHVVQRSGVGESSEAILIKREGNIINPGSYWSLGLGVSGGTNNDFLFHYNRNLKAEIENSDGSYNQISDRRVKEGIETPDAVLGKVMKLKPKRYFYKSDEERKKKSYGFIAQDVSKLFPSFVSDMEDDLKGIAYDNFGVLAIQAIQEQQKQIKTLKQENKKLRQKLSEMKKLKQRVRQLEAEIQE